MNESQCNILKSHDNKAVCVCECVCVCVCDWWMQVEFLLMVWETLNDGSEQKAAVVEIRQNTETA